MPGDPRECRHHAENCRHLASETRSATVRSTFLILAERWQLLAEELESDEQSSKAMDEIRPPSITEEQVH